MKPGPSNAKARFLKLIEVDAAPKSAQEWLVEVSIAASWYSNAADALEAAARWEQQFLTLLRSELSESNLKGRFAAFAFNSSSDYLIQGCAFIEPKDSEDIKAAKRRRAQYKDYETALGQLSPKDFEALCAGMLEEFGVDNPKLSTYSADEGIDFYGQLRLARFMFLVDIYPGIQSQLTTWIIGQAKHYHTGQVSTNEIRDLVGAVELAKGKAFGASDDPFTDLRLRVCDPVFYLFVTTSRLTRNSWHLLEQSGVVGMDGEMVASFLADRSIGTINGVFSVSAFESWVGKFRHPD